MIISVGNSRMDKRWKNRELSWEEFKNIARATRRTTETAEEYRRMKKAGQDAVKDVGGFVGGALREGRRKNGYVLSRSLLTLDMDYATPGVWEDVISLRPWACCAYSTHKHTPEAPRLRLIIPLSREVSEDEYPALGRMVAKEIGLDLFDDTTYEPARLMYWPSTPVNGEFLFHEKDGPLLNPDEYLSRYRDWRDVSSWPVSSRQSEVVRHTLAQQADPLAKEGIVGAFCRAYSVQEAIDAFLSDVYEPSVLDGRYDYIPADSTAGVVLYDDKFAYSHHATDPACGRLLNAFDLVRFHRFRDLEEKESFRQMADFAAKDEKVKIQLAEERSLQAREEFGAQAGDWRALLKYESRGTLLSNCVWNLMLIFNNDPDLANFAYNELANRIQVTGSVPWERPADNRFWRDADTAQLKALIDVRYLAFSSRNHDVCFAKVADDRRFHPIRDYLNSLPAWDGVSRIDTLLARCLEADDTPYVRSVTRKTFAAAVARIYRPGTKFDCVLVFDGAQGIGKSTLFKDLVGDEYYSESLSLTDMDDKSGAEKLQGFWAVEIPEFAGMKKADIEKVKGFLSTSDDKYRPSYGKTVESHPRQCIILGTVNGERGYLRDITGNRRFWIVKVHQEEQVKRWHFTPEERDQIWAEAKAVYESGEKLYLEGEMIEAAEEAQREAMEQDERYGMVQEYLNILLPDNWAVMDVFGRQAYIRSPDDPIHPKGMNLRLTVSNMEIWCECFGKKAEDLKPADSHMLGTIMKRMEGWKGGKSKTMKHYGKQRIYVRLEQS